jgi:hypothetical protein
VAERAVHNDCYRVVGSHRSETRRWSRLGRVTTVIERGGGGALADVVMAGVGDDEQGTEPFRAALDFGADGLVRISGRSRSRSRGPESETMGAQMA